MLAVCRLLLERDRVSGPAGTGSGIDCVLELDRSRSDSLCAVNMVLTRMRVHASKCHRPSKYQRTGELAHLNDLADKMVRGRSNRTTNNVDADQPREGGTTTMANESDSKETSPGAATSSDGIAPHSSSSPSVPRAIPAALTAPEGEEEDIPLSSGTVSVKNACVHPGCFFTSFKSSVRWK